MRIASVTGLAAVSVLIVPGVCRAELRLEKVWPEKVYCTPGEIVSLEVVVANPDGAGASGRLVVELVHGLDTVIGLADEDVTVEPGGALTWREEWTARGLLGIELRATLSRAGTRIARRSEYFTCCESVHQVLMLGRGNHGGMQFSGSIDDSIDEYAPTFAMQWRTQYGNFFDYFAWGESDFDDLTPERDKWWSGQTCYNTSRPNIIAVFRAFHAQGVQVVTYGKAAAGGVVGYENLRRRPDLAGYTDGRPWLENYDAAFLDWIKSLGPPKRGERRPIPGTPEEMEKAGYEGSARFATYTKGGAKWCSVWYPCTRDEVLDIGVKELVGSARMFGLDGVRFDGEFFAARHRTLDGSFVAGEDFDAEAANVHLVRRMKDTIWRTRPGYLFGYNTGTQISWAIGDDNVPASFREKCRGDGLIANEALAFPGDVPWLQYAETVRREAEIVRYYGGHHSTYAFNRTGDRPYNFIVNFAMRSHLMNWYQGSAFDNADFSRFGSRFASLLWDRELRSWAEAEKDVSIESDRDVWWEPFAAARPAPGLRRAGRRAGAPSPRAEAASAAQAGAGTQFVLHLINPPEGETTMAKDVLPAAPARNVTVRFEKAKGFRRAALVNFPSCEVRPIEPERRGRELAFIVSEIPYWAILVVEADVPTPEPRYEKARAAGVATPSAEDLELTPQSDTSRDKLAWRDVLEPERWGGGESTADRVKDPDALNGGAVRGKPGRRVDGMAYTYGYPRIPGKYRATFRLKVADNTVAAPVFRLNIDDWRFHPLAGVPKLPNPTLEVKATDFKRPGVYEDVAIPFEHSDVGFLGVGCVYLGNVEGSWDRVVLDLVEPWTHERLVEHYSGMAAPKDLELKRDGKLDVLAVRGLWNRLYRIDEAVESLGGDAALTAAYTTFHQQHDTQLSGFKLEWGPLFTQDVVVLANVETRGLGLGQTRMIGEFVRRGGGLVILGGLMTLGQAGNMQRGWPEFLPVELSAPWEIRRSEPPVGLAGPPRASPLAGVRWGRADRLFYRHMVKAKPGATILQAGRRGEPLIVGMAQGGGRVAVFTGTVLGEPGRGQAAFWDSPAWKEALARTMAWAAGERRP